MKSLSKILLLSAVGLCVESGNLAYASFEDNSSLLKSGIPTLHTHHTYHTSHIHTPYSGNTQLIITPF